MWVRDIYIILHPLLSIPLWRDLFSGQVVKIKFHKVWACPDFHRSAHIASVVQTKKAAERLPFQYPLADSNRGQID